MSHKQSKRERPPAELVELINISMPELNAIVEEARTRPLTAEEAQRLKATFSTLAYLKQVWQSKTGSIKRLLKMLFGAQTEKTDTVLKESGEAPAGAEASAPAPAGGDTPRGSVQKAGDAVIKRKGHGRNAASALSGAKRVPVPLIQYEDGEGCPHCTGKLYPFEGRALVRITGVGPLMATVYECEQKRCNGCLEVFTAPAPEGIGEKKYDETATATLGLIHYSCGLPLNQIEKLQEGYGVACATSTQWDLLEEGAEQLKPAYHEMVRQGAQKNLQHTDDTKKRILGLSREDRIDALGAKAAEKRKGCFTSAILCIGEGVQIALYFTGVRHAGENFNELLKHRAAGLPPPIQMCDGSLTNIPKDFDTLLANCLAHARRGPAEVVDDFPEEVRFVLESLREVYKVDAEAREAGLSPNERLHLHQEKSKPWMRGLKHWIHRQFDHKLTEPNSDLGVALTYILDHWGPLTLFLRQPGCPLDNNICERLLKKAIRHRRNSLYYRTAHGAETGDTWMSLIHTAEMNGGNAFEYLVALLRHPKELAANPRQWMPWTFQGTLERMETVADPPAGQKAA